MKRLFFLCTVLFFNQWVVGQTLNGPSSPVESGSVITITASGESNEAYFGGLLTIETPKITSSSPDAFGLNWVSITNQQWLNNYNHATRQPTRFTVKIVNNHPTSTYVLRVPVLLNIENSVGKPFIINTTKYFNITVKPAAPKVYKNAYQEKAFVRNNCGSDFVGSQVIYSVSAGKYTASTQAEADAKAKADIEANGQNYANANGNCTTAYFNREQKGSFVRNTCGPNTTSGAAIPYTIPARRYKASTQAAADNLAKEALNREGQANANTVGECVKATIYVRQKLPAPNQIQVFQGVYLDGRPSTDFSVRSDKYDIQVEFFSDAQCTKPLLIAPGLQIKYEIVKTTFKSNGIRITPNSQTFTRNYNLTTTTNSIVLELGFYELFDGGDSGPYAMGYNQSFRLLPGDYIIVR